MAGKQVGKQMAKRAVGKEFKRQSKHLATPNNMLPNNVGWGPRQSIHVVHDKNSAGFPKLYFPERWDAVNEGAPEVGIWYQGKFGNPRTAANHSIPGKAEKAAKAREIFAKRPYRVEGNLFEHVKRKANTTDFYDFKTRKLLVPENEAPDLETYNYLLIEGETAANTMELGKRLGLQPGQEYPGRQALEQMLKEFSESGNEHAFITKYLNMKHPKRVWNALTGKYFVYPLIGTTLIGGMNYDRNE